MPNNLSQYEPGQIVCGIDLSVFRVTSKVAGPLGSVVKVATLHGEPVSLPPDFTPIGPRMARFASMMFHILAFNKDFDLYVRAYCERAGLPIPVGPDGQPFRWAEWFQTTIFPKLRGPKYKSTEDIRDEAIHEMLFHELGQNNVLGKFKEAMKNFHKDIRKLPLENQLTVYLSKVFRGRVEKMNRKIRDQEHPQEMSMFQPGHGEEAEEFNILDTDEHAKDMGEVQTIESAHDIGKFRNGFYAWLKKHQSEKAAKSFIGLFDIYWQWVGGASETEDPETGRPAYMPMRRSLEPLWVERTKLSPAALYSYIGKLAALLEKYILENRHNLGEGNIFVKLIDGIHHQREKLRADAEQEAEQSKKKRKGMHAAIAALSLAGVEKSAAGMKWFEVEHGNEFTCPHCNVGLAAHDWSTEYGDPLPGTHDVTCPNCHKNFLVSVEVVTRYKSRTASFKVAKLMRGDQLTPEMEQQVKDAFVMRWTRENTNRTLMYNCDKCDIMNPYVNTQSSNGHSHPTVPLQSDEQWINEHSFTFTNAGRLMARGGAQPAYLAGEPNPVLAADKTAEFGENVLPPEPPEGYGEEKELEGVRMDREHRYCPRCLECTDCNLRPCTGGQGHLPGVPLEEKWSANQEYIARTLPPSEEDEWGSLDADDQQLLRQEGLDPHKESSADPTNDVLVQAVANLLEAHTENMVSGEDWQLLADAAGRGGSTLANVAESLLDARESLTEQDWTAAERAYEAASGHRIERHEGLPYETPDHGGFEKESTEPLQQLRPTITPGDTGRLPHARTQGSLKEGAADGGSVVTISVRENGEEIGSEEYTGDFAELVPYVESVSAEHPEFTVVMIIDEEGVITEDSYVAGAWMKDTKEKFAAVESGREAKLVELLRRAASSLQEYCAELNGDMNDSLAMEIEQTLDNIMGFKTGGDNGQPVRPPNRSNPINPKTPPPTPDKMPKNAAPVPAVAPANPADARAAQVSPSLPVPTGTMTPQQMQQTNQSKAQGQAAPQTPAQALNNQNPAVALMPSGQNGDPDGDTPMKRTVPPELPNQRFHMSNDELVDRKRFFASVKRKYAGGQDFATVGTGKTAQEAFNNAASEARHEHGHGGYTGTIAEKHGFVLVAPPKGIEPKRYARWLMRVGDEDEGPIQESREIVLEAGKPCPKCKKGPIAGSNFPECPNCKLRANSGRGNVWTATEWVDIPAEFLDQIRRDALKVDDKHGPAGAVQIAPNKWLFFGVASS